MFKLDLEKAEEPEIKLLTSVDVRKSKRIPEKNIYFCFIHYTKACVCVDHNKLWKIQEMGIPDHLTCLLRNLCAGQEATVGTGLETTDRFQIGKGVCKGCILSPCLFNFYAECTMRKGGLDEAQAGVKIAGRNINNLRYADDTTLMAESEEELKSRLMKKWKRREKSWLKAQHSENEDHGIWSHHFIANRWRNSGNSGRLYFGGSKITADGDCSYEIKRCLLLGRKVMTNLDSILKSRDSTFPTKFHLIKAIVFPAVMYGCESWTIKKAECRRIVAFELWYWRRLLSPLDCKEIQPVSPKGDQSWIFIGRTDAEAETPILWPPDVKNWLNGKDPDAGKDWRQEEKGTTEDEMVGWHHQLNGHEFEQALEVGDGQGSLMSAVHGGHKELDTTEQLNWTNLLRCLVHRKFTCITKFLLAFPTDIHNAHPWLWFVFSPPATACIYVCVLL